MFGQSRTLLLTRARIAELATSKDYLASMQKAFVQLAHGDVALPLPAHADGVGGVFHIKSASHRTAPWMTAIKVNANFPDNAHVPGLPTIHGLIGLFDARSGSLLALMDSIEVTTRRTAAATALAAKYLARADSTALGVIGCGMQARYHLEALLDVLPLREVRFCEPREEAAESFARELENRGLRHTRAQTARDAALGSDVIVTLTTSSHPILHADDVAPGTFVAGVGADNPSKNELAPDLLRASRVVVDLLSQAVVMGDVHHAVQSGDITEADIHGELSKVVSGDIPGRRGEHERFVFDSTGIAVQDLAAAAMIYDRACANESEMTLAFNDT